MLTIKSLNSLVTRKAIAQFVNTQAPLDMPLALSGKISDVTSHGIGPQPRAKPAITNRRELMHIKYLLKA